MNAPQLFFFNHCNKEDKMKNYILILALILSNYLMAQEELGWMEMEIFIMTTGLSQGETVRYKMEALGTVWRAEKTSPPSGYEFSTTHNLAYYPILTQSETGNTNFNNLSTIWGYNWMQPFITYNQSYDSIAHGLYKVSASLSDQYFYLDYRDDRYNWSTIYVQAPGALDIWILYNKNLNRFMYRKEGIQSPNPQYWSPIQKGDHIGLWNIKEVGIPTTSNFPDFWSNCLSVNNVNNHPKLIWGAYPESVDLAGYNIYRKVGSGYFNLIDFNYENEFHYIDEDYTITSPTGTQLQYYVKAVYVSDGLSLPTNTVTTQGITINKNVPSKNLINEGYTLSNNYPNPFNSSTIITFTLLESNFITLTVYDLLGREIATLVSEIKQVGTHSVIFNADGLQSGLYLYKIENGIYFEFRKMILLK
jgi:hypothetical protein